MCNREGVKNTSIDFGETSKKKRRRVSKRNCCMDMMSLKYIRCDGYSVGLFEERHSHSLTMDTHKEFMNLNRNIDPSYQRFILNYARVNIGPVTTFRLFKEVVGGYSNIGCTTVDFKNFSPDLKAYVMGVHAQMMLDKMAKRHELCSTFTFDYEVNKNNQLRCLFWADPISRRRFSLFGDVVSFDATYRTNMYSMIFAPFTGKDNHGKLMTFGAILMSGEDAECYSWVLQKFKDCMSASPSLIITDQDLGLKIAKERDIQEETIVGSRHCMISVKIGFLRSKSNLVEFLMNFDSALDSKRHAHAYLDSVDESSMPQLKTPFAFEKHAATVYTRNKFYEVQKKIEDACYVCRVCNISENDLVVVLEVNDGFGATNKVVHNKVEDSTACNYLKFVRDGMLCCHIFTLFKDLKLESIPAKYIVPCWMKSSLINEASALLGDRCFLLEENKIVTNQLISEFYACLSVAKGDIAKMSLLLQSIHELRDGFLSGDIEDDTLSKKSRLFSDFYGLCAPSEFEVHPRDLVKIKGTESRIKSKEEARAEYKKKPLRTCKKCGKKCNHDSRNCGKK
ncbi:hypothetical protein C2S53_003293 [Perilla frutescens var. hirtella]|uniref:MULE transposase domain-containing protein n=1 Tax=Perilla frutescens var. hirtella TaxID=608512 RepID=A0AAD4P613_PERFH|nr:hypothetical protein C2S53_003293 [Perilla frutescens var. hirtella]